MNKAKRSMLKSILASFLSLMVLVATIVWFALTPESEYIWGGSFYIALIIISSLASIASLIGVLANYNSAYYNKKRYKKLIDKYSKVYDPTKSISVDVNDLLYYLNKYYLGGDRIVIKCGDEFHILERQVLPDKSRGIYGSIYSFDHKLFGSRFDKLLVYQYNSENSLSDLKTIELIYRNGKYPKLLAIKRNYDNCLPHPNLTIWGVFLSVIGIVFCLFAIGNKDWISYLIVGGLMLSVGAIFILVLTKKIRLESLVK
ncbi:MAG: phage holin family protein [Bacilli bacterium]|nr:phage holin family protein [Bacilli bacterium]